MRRQGPDRQAALEQYRRRAGLYDLELALFEPIRREAIARLALQPGEGVLDLGCGTGLSLAPLREGVGAAGRIIGIEQSPAMIERARARVLRAGWRNVTLLCAPVHEACWQGLADAALFQFTHDIVRHAPALDNVVQHLKPRARIVACGLKWAPRWVLPANLAVLTAAWRSATTLEGLEAPWSRLAARTGPMQIESRLFGAVYIASAVLQPRPAGLHNLRSDAHED